MSEIQNNEVNIKRDISGAVSNAVQQTADLNSNTVTGGVVTNKTNILKKY